MASPIDSIRSELADLTQAGLTRSLRPVDGPQGPLLRLGDREVHNFCSNDYLGLAGDPLLATAIAAALAAHGVGAGAARLISGNLTPHRELEDQLCQWKGAEAALLFSTGYQANLGLVSTLAGPDDVIFSDELAHASLIDGCRLSRARVVVFPHRDLGALGSALERERGRRQVIVTESIFSMDGDRPDLDVLLALARQHEALLILDEAHALGVLGPGGAGLSPLPTGVVVMGTFGKALGGFGAFVAGPQPVVSLLLQRARSFVFTTAPQVASSAAASAALAWLASPEGATRRAQLGFHVERFHAGLIARGLPAPPGPSHIVPLRVRGGAPEEALVATAALLERGIYVQAIRPPTVPMGTSRLRLTLMATHTETQREAVLDALAALRHHFEL